VELVNEKLIALNKQMQDEEGNETEEVATKVFNLS
jgi:hypothetical protein